MQRKTYSGSTKARSMYQRYEDEPLSVVSADGYFNFTDIPPDLINEGDLIEVNGPGYHAALQLTGTINKSEWTTAVRYTSELTPDQISNHALIDMVFPDVGDIVPSGNVITAPDGAQYTNTSSSALPLPASLPSADFIKREALTLDHIAQINKVKALSPDAGDVVALGQIVVADDGRQYQNTSGENTVMPASFPATGFSEYHKDTLSTVQDLRDYAGSEVRVSLAETCGTFFWRPASTMDDDGGMVLAKTGHTGAGRWVRKTDYIKPEFYGGTFDGVANDRASIVSATAASPLHNKPTLIEQPTAMSGAAIPVENVTIICRKGGSIVKTDDTGVPLFEIQTGGNVSFKGLKMVGPKDKAAMTYTANQNAVTTVLRIATDPAIPNVEVRRCNISAFGDAAITGDLLDKFDFNKNEITFCGRAGALLSGAQTGKFRNNTVSDIAPGAGGVPAFANAYGITVTQDVGANKAVAGAYPAAKDIRIFGNHIKNIPTWTAIDTHANTGVGVYRNTIENCLIPIYLGASSGTVDDSAYDCYASDNIIKNPPAASRAAIIVSPTQPNAVASEIGARITVSRNKITGYGRSQATVDAGFGSFEGVIHVASATGVTVKDNELDDFHLCGISVEGAITDARIEGNTLRNGVEVGGACYVMFEMNIDGGVDQDIISYYSGNKYYGTTPNVEFFGTSGRAPTGPYGPRFANDNKSFGHSAFFASGTEDNLHPSSSWYEAVSFAHSELLDFPAIAAGEREFLSVTIPGLVAALSPQVGVSFNKGSGSELGLIESAYCSADNTALVVLENRTTASIDPANQVFSFSATQKRVG